MQVKMLKMNNYFIKNHKKIFGVLSFLILALILSSVYLLFATVSYRYSIAEKTKQLDNLLVENSKIRSKNINLE